MDNLWLKVENIVFFVLSNFFFCHYVSKFRLLQRRQKASIWGKGLTTLINNLCTFNCGEIPQCCLNVFKIVWRKFDVTFITFNYLVCVLRQLLQRLFYIYFKMRNWINFKKHVKRLMSHKIPFCLSLQPNPKYINRTNE